MSHSGKSLMRGRSSGLSTGRCSDHYSIGAKTGLLERDALWESTVPFLKSGLRDLHKAIGITQFDTLSTQRNRRLDLSRYTMIEHNAIHWISLHTGCLIVFVSTSLWSNLAMIPLVRTICKAHLQRGFNCLQTETSYTRPSFGSHLCNTKIWHIAMLRNHLCFLKIFSSSCLRWASRIPISEGVPYFSSSVVYNWKDIQMRSAHPTFNNPILSSAKAHWVIATVPATGLGMISRINFLSRVLPLDDERRQ